MREIMKRAHEIARTLEGDYAARLTLGMRQAWSEAKAPKTAMLSVRHQPSGGREWVAEITGTHPKYKFDRKFISYFSTKWSGSGKTGSTYFELEEGKIYEVNEPWKGRRFVKVVNGKVYEIETSEVKKAIA